MKYTLAALAAAGLLLGAPAMAADDGQALAQKHACMSCHQVDKKVVGPAFKEVSAKYKGDKTAQDKLVAKVKAGGSGVWGPVPMPPNPQVPEADIKTIVSWILAIK
jgi:cytochrome c